MLFLSSMKSSLKLLLVLAASAFCLVQPVKASPTAQAGPTSINGVVPVPDAGSTLPFARVRLVSIGCLAAQIEPLRLV
jgi:hypothetical protein